MKKLIEIYTDGAVSGNPGPGGAAAIIIDSIIEEFIYTGNFSNETTNQRMELEGIILGLNEVLDNHTIITNDLGFSEIKIYSDSAYCVRAFNEGWIVKWQSNGWITSTKQSVANQDLWENIIRLITILKSHGACVSFIKVKGHSNNKYNNIADQIAVTCKKRQDIFYSREQMSGESE